VLVRVERGVIVEAYVYLVATGSLDGFAHLEHFQLDNFMFGVALAVVSEGPRQYLQNWYGIEEVYLTW
jgi:hypothetical protein